MREPTRPDRPDEALRTGLNALNGVCDLLLSNLRVERNDMHVVDPENLAALLDLVAMRLQDAAELLETR